MGTLDVVFAVLGFPTVFWSVHWFPSELLG